MNITCSVVTYNSEKDILGVLKSFSDCESLGLNIAVTVIDNCSSDNTVNLVKSHFPNVHIIEHKTNDGYGVANNKVIMDVKSDYHIVCNPDVTFKPSEFDKMVSFMEDHDDVALLIPKVLNLDGTEQFLPKKFPALRYVIASRFERFGGVFSKLRAEYTLKDQNITKPVDVDYATGCFMFFRTKDLQAVGGFDSRYFLYSEDADITLKIKTQGRTVYVPDVCVTHVWKRETMKSKKAFCIQIHSLLKFYFKWGIRL